MSTLLNKYLREFMLKLKAEKTALGRIAISPSSTSGEKTQAINETQKIDSILQELGNLGKRGYLYTRITTDRD